MNETLTIVTAARLHFITVQPEASVWDAVQATTYDNLGRMRGRGDFDCDGYRIMAANQREATMIAKRLRVEGYQPRMSPVT